MKTARRLEVFLANLAWLLACLPGSLAFLFAICFPRFAQRRLLRQMLKRAAATRYGQQHGFEQMANDLNGFRSHPVSSYEAFRPFVDSVASGEPNVLTSEPVIILQPTSGTSAARKVIPLTRGLLRQFQAAIAPWIASLYLLRPRLLFGRQYWCISPNTTAPCDDTAVHVGFADDTEYLGAWQRGFAAKLMVAPPELARVEDPAAFEFLTLLFLVREKNLRLISVWHPSFLTLLLDALPKQAGRLGNCLRTGTLPDDLALRDDIRAALIARFSPDPQRAGEFSGGMASLTAQLSWLWPRLQVISCWAGHDAGPVLTRLRRAFPRVTIQPKGLLATEGVVSIPWGFSGKHVAAVRSHFLEFIEMDSGRTMRLWELQRGQVCSALITTAGGLYRYRLHDRVRAADFRGRTPCLEFIGREGLVSDLCGEKLTSEDVESALEHFSKTTRVIFQFAMAVPDTNGKVPGYVLILETAGESALPAGDTCSAIFEGFLQRNFHYAHARRLGQLQPVRILSVRNAAATCRDALVRRGRRHGEIKFPVLCKETGLADDFRMS